MEYSFPYRVWLLHNLGFVTRMKYYGVWSITEGACVMAGISYNGIDEKTGKARWGRSTRFSPVYYDPSLPLEVAELCAIGPNSEKMISHDA